MDATAISVSGLVKTFGPTRALDGLDLEVRAGEVHGLLGRLRGGLNEQRKANLLDRFDLDPRKKARTYSKGNRQKVALIAALSSNVELLLLDEPTAGLDPLMEDVFRQVIREEQESHGRTVL